MRNGLSMCTRRALMIGLVLSGAALTAQAAEPIVIIALGDSITKGVRPGVKTEETFVGLLAARCKEKDLAVRFINAGVGGERTDGALKRLERDVLVHKPKVVLVMYGTNDSYVDRGKTESRLSIEQYRANLVKIVENLEKAGIKPVLMTEPRWAAGSKNGLGESPNDRLGKYMAACREVAKEKEIRLVDHFAHWSKAESRGVNIRGWTTDGCHPNPRGHREIADLIWPELIEVLSK